MKALPLFFGLFAYIIGLIGQIWFILFISPWNILQKDINSSQTVNLSEAIFIDLALILLFGLQHSLMAREWFKSAITKFLPRVIERSLYVLLSGLVFIIFCLYYEPIDGFLWRVNSGFWYYILSLGFIFGWGLSLYASFIINHFELFGLEQGYLHLKGKEPKEVEFKEKQLYKYIRHPIQFGVLLGLWLNPFMSYGNLIIAIGFTIYIFIGLYFEEQALIKEFGNTYQNYKNRVGFIYPKLFKIKKISK